MMTESQFTTAIDGAINDFVDGVSDAPTFRDAIMTTLLTLRAEADPRTLTNYVDTCHAIAKSKGFHDEKKEFGTWLMLVVSELGEALEADRKGRKLEDPDLLAMLQVELNQERFAEGFKLHVKDTREDELADAVIRIFDLAGLLGIDLEAHIKAKMRFNLTRGYKHGKAY